MYCHWQCGVDFSDCLEDKYGCDAVQVARVAEMRKARAAYTHSGARSRGLEEPSALNYEVMRTLSLVRLQVPTSPQGPPVRQKVKDDSLCLVGASSRDPRM